MIFYGRLYAITDSCIIRYSMKLKLHMQVRRKIYGDSFDLALVRVGIGILDYVIPLVQDMHKWVGVFTVAL